MKGFAQGLIVGAAVTAAALVGYAYGQSNEQDLLESGQCRVQVGYGHMTGDYMCRFNQVQVGQQNNYIYCADVTVSCN